MGHFSWIFGELPERLARKWSLTRKIVKKPRFFASEPYFTGRRGASEELLAIFYPWLLGLAFLLGSFFLGRGAPLFFLLGGPASSLPVKYIVPVVGIVFGCADACDAHGFCIS